MTIELQKYYDPSGALTCSLCLITFSKGFRDPGFSVTKRFFFVINVKSYIFNLS